ncbi:MAG: hypothetical protein ACPGYX_00740 [Oceanobacter sp.]
MLGLVISGVLATLALCVGFYLFAQKKVLADEMTLDEAKGYLLIVCVLAGFAVSAAEFYFGQTLGFNEQNGRTGELALAMLLDITTALSVLIYGLQRMRMPEQY